ncbi:bifunctional YncE family protein/alkaline phosphatase family protein [Streptomyces sp. RB6PN25]|uniref:Bifunctional YncE family protein/alkaline phosphatase family protein n=1 Tax=Streptomyces humicola TaxID=2953240 RepID=A0ABT1PQR5_9ACTN|nr:bifunctional YncE family protein/alkaline phosphatase family protein [Streptomyces humicola]MCQ4080012.1 bifunctional YncE family protein/alkaline phosphatase family protein [Streptomyces humicola]
MTTILALAGTGIGVTYAAGGFGNTTLGSKLVGKQADGSYLTSNNQFVTPAGDTISEFGRPMDLAVSPDGKTAAAPNTASPGIVTIFDLVGRKVLQQYQPPSGTGNGKISNGGILYSPDGKHLWLAQTSDLLRFDVSAHGTVSAPVVVPLPGVSGRQAVPTDLAWAPNGTDLLVTLSGNNTLGVVDTTTNTVTRQIPVGNVPDKIAVVGGKVYVSNQGGRTAQPGDQTDDSYGTPIVTNGNQDSMASTGTVSEVDLSAGRQMRTFTVGLEPSALLASGSNLIVANSNDDTVSVIDTAKQQVGQTFSVNPAPGSKFGAQPNALTMLDPTHLAVSLARDNAVAVYDFSGAYGQPSFEGLIPTGWVPGSLYEDTQLHRLLVASEQGLGSVGPNGSVDEGGGPVTGHQVYNYEGTLQLVPTPSSRQIEADTQQVFKNNQWNGLLGRNQAGNGRTAPVAVPLHVGDPSKIQHVFLIVKENRTYDQVLGDDLRGNGDPAYAQFGKQVTPNIHALATRFPLIDNLYSDGTNSAEGHNWIDQAFTNSYLQQMYGNYTRSYGGDDALLNVKSGFIWDDALAHGKSVTDWGEYADGYKTASGQPVGGTWQQWYQDSQILEGKATGQLHVPIGTYQPTTDIPSLKKVLQPNFPDFQLNIPDQYRADLFQSDFATYVEKGNLPSLNMMWLMNDHTEGTSPGAITPSAHVADNDLALGRIVDTISHSPYWKNSAIFVMEDDSQNGIDHVDGHRNPTLVISPYAKRGAVVDTYYTQLNVVRTIEQILGLPPMNQEDMTANPMYDVFSNKPDFTPYTYLPNQIPLTTTNPQPNGLGGAAKVWAQWSAQQNYKSEDMVNMQQENRDIWYSSNGFTTPFPGDSKVLLPNQVPGADTAPTGDGDDG